MDTHDFLDNGYLDNLYNGYSFFGRSSPFSPCHPQAQFVELLRFIYTSPLRVLLGESSRTGKFSEKLTELNEKTKKDKL